MSRRNALRLYLAAFAVALLIATLGTSSASAATQLVTNGDFETGSLSGWQTSYETFEGEWFAYDREEEEAGNEAAFPPPAGRYAAADRFEYPDSAVLFQQISLPAGTTDQLSMILGYDSTQPMSVRSPDTLEANSIGNGNQQVRVDVLKAGAPIRSLASGDILATVFATSNGSPEEFGPTTLTADLSAFAGQSVVLRIANAVEEGLMSVTVDNVSIESNPIPPPPPSNVFTEGKLTLNKKKGTGSLAVNVPGAGVLTVAGGGTIKKAEVTSTGAQTLKVPLKAKGAGQKTLSKKGKLPFKVALTFTPTGGTSATQTYSGRLVKRLKPARR